MYESACLKGCGVMTIRKNIVALVGPDNFHKEMIQVFISKDALGKTITVADEDKSFTFAFEHIEEDLK